MISFYAFHGDPILRNTVIERLSLFADQGRLLNGGDRILRRSGFIAALANGDYDLAAAHHDCGFPVPLLIICETIFEQLERDEAAAFALELLNAARVDADVAELAEQFLSWMFEDAVAAHGPVRIRISARDAGNIFSRVSEAPILTPGLVKKAKIAAKKDKKRGLRDIGPAEAIIERAMIAAMHRSGENADRAIHWMASLAADSEGEYRRYARKIIALVQSA